MPPNIAVLPIDHRGFPVPYFVALIDGQPDHRVLDGKKMPRALQLGLCWICGRLLHGEKTFSIGPMCAITRTISEPPSHRACAEWSAQACPFLSRPHAKRRPQGLPDDATWSETAIQRNPGAVCCWTTETFMPFRAPDGGTLFEIGDPTAATWWAEGRPATRAEVDASVESGIPLLGCPPEEQAELWRRRALLNLWLDEVFPAAPQ